MDKTGRADVLVVSVADSVTFSEATSTGQGCGEVGVWKNLVLW